MAYFEDKTISNKKTSALVLLLCTQLEHDICNKHIMQEQEDLLQVFVYYYFKQHPGFFSGRVVDSWPGVEPWMEILEWRAIFF